MFLVSKFCSVVQSISRKKKLFEIIFFLILLLLAFRWLWFLLFSSATATAAATASFANWWTFIFIRFITFFVFAILFLIIRLEERKLRINELTISYPNEIRMCNVYDCHRQTSSSSSSNSSSSSSSTISPV